jgi:hypothetical protein
MLSIPRIMGRVSLIRVFPVGSSISHVLLSSVLFTPGSPLILPLKQRYLPCAGLSINKVLFLSAATRKKPETGSLFFKAVDKNFFKY